MTDTENVLPNGWRGRIAALDVLTGDERMLATPPGGIRTRDFPMSITRKHVGEGTDIWIGTMDHVWVEEDGLYGEGSFDLGGEDGREAARQLVQGLNTVSIHPDEVTFEHWLVKEDTNTQVSFDEAIDTSDPENPKLRDGFRTVAVMVDWRLASVAVVSIPAFDEARIEPIFGYVARSQAAHLCPTCGQDVADSAPAAIVEVEVPEFPEDESLVATVTGNLSYPMNPDRNVKWDGHKARRAFAKWASSDGSGDLDKINQAKFSTGFLYRGKPGTGNSLDGATLAEGSTTWRVEDYKLPFVGIVDGKPMIFANAIIGLAGGHGIKATNIPANEKKILLGRLKSLYAKAKKVFPDFPDYPFSIDGSPFAQESPSLDSLVGQILEDGTSPTQVEEDSLVAASGPSGQIFLASSFEDPKFDRPTPLTVERTPDGRTLVYGHVAEWGSCYRAFGNHGEVCRTIPRNQTDYKEFHLHGARLEDGSIMPVGALSFGEGHHAAGGLRASQKLYADVATIAAKVRAGEDRFGVWIAGEVIDAFADRADDLLLSPISGHWEPDLNQRGAPLEMLAAHVVVTAGFSVPRPRSLVASVDDDGEILAMRVYGPWDGGQNGTENGTLLTDRREALLARFGMDPESRREAVRSRFVV